MQIKLRSADILGCLLLLGAGNQTIGAATDHEVFVSADTPTPHGAWRYRQLRGAEMTFCRAKEAPECIINTLSVENISDDTLECLGAITYDGVNNEAQARVAFPAVILPREARSIIADRAKPDVAITRAGVDCKVRAPRPRLNVPANCRYQVIKAPALDDYYSPQSRRLGEEGPVDLEFTLQLARDHPTDVKVVASSLFQRLDASAIEYIKSLQLETPCPGTRYEIRMKFKLAE